MELFLEVHKRSISSQNYSKKKKREEAFVVRIWTIIYARQLRKRGRRDLFGEFLEVCTNKKSLQ